MTYTEQFIENYSEHTNEELLNETLLQVIIEGNVEFGNPKIKQAALKLFEEREMYEICNQIVNS